MIQWKSSAMHKEIELIFAMSSVFPIKDENNL